LGKVGPSEELLERDAERAEIGEVVLRCGGGESGSLLALEGPAGIGKTRLLEEVRVHARRAGLMVLSARYGELERDHPLGVARQLFEGPLMAAGEAARASLLSGPAGLAAPLLTGVPAVDPPGDPVLAMLQRSTGWSPTWRKSDRSRWWSTTGIGPTPPRCERCCISPAASTIYPR